jgi:uncharacterized protein
MSVSSGMAPNHRARRALALLVLAAVLGGCTSSSVDETSARPDAEVAGVRVERAPAGYEVSPGVEQLLVTGAAPGQELRVLDASGEVVADRTADATGSLLVRDLLPGSGYVVSAATEDGEVSAPPTDVWGVEDVPDPSFYAQQELVEGYQYLEARDGTTLAVHVTLPGPVEDGPYPTVVEYSGYDPANPGGLQPSKLIAGMLGYATVGVNMRGTGCSGGSFLFYEPAQVTDGYDVIEIVGAQEWVAGGRVGMVGLSYPGISQLFVAQARPPSLAAIAPLSVIEDTYRSTLYPGGILNSGFALEWAEGRQRDGEPGGQPWSQERIDDGDAVCEANQALRSQNPDLFDFVAATAFVPEEMSGYLGGLAPSRFVDRIDVPVFLAGAWQDEQTGGRFANMLDRFTGAPLTRFTMTNGGHTEPFAPEILLRWTEFLDLYVAERVPRLPEGFEGPLGILGGAVFGTQLVLPERRFSDLDPTDLETARRRYESEAPVRVLFEQGAGAEPGAPVPGFTASFDSWPIPSTVPTTWYLQPGGALGVSPPPEKGVESYAYDTSRAQQVSLPEGRPWGVAPTWRWEGPVDGTALAYASPPLETDVVMAGTGRVDLRFSSSAQDVDLQVTLSEIRPDGNEVYVQNGWLRASHRAVDTSASGPLRVEHTYRASDAEPLPGEGRFTEVAVELFPFAHVFRSGSQIRLTVEGPGGTRPEWKFEAIKAPDGTTNRVELGGRDQTASRVSLPVLAGFEVPTSLPPCGALRGQPCRPVQILQNRAG